MEMISRKEQLDRESKEHQERATTESLNEEEANRKATEWLMKKVSLR